VPISNADLFAVLIGQGNPIDRNIVLELRLPRVLLGILVGGGL
ncbi:uncharacterized protein METZ01_LOCUS196396, partial [marine metagenome]